MVRFAPAAVLLLLSLPCSLVPAAGGVDSAPSWNRGDRWEYNVTVKGSAEMAWGNLSQEVTAAGPVRFDNRTSDAYTLTSRQTTRSTGGVNSTVTTTTYVSRTDLCVLYVNSSSATTLGGLSSKARSALRYDASDGRYRFPLGSGTGWQADYTVNRTVRLDSGQWTDNITVHAVFGCEGPEPVVVPAGRFMAQKIVCQLDMRNTTTYWFSGGARGEVKREEMDGSSGQVTTYVLKRYHREPQPMFLLGTDTGRAMVLGAISLVLVAAGVAIYLRRRNERRGGPTRNAGPSKSI